MTDEQLDHPFYEVAERANQLIKRENCRVYQKWTCSNCHARQTMPDANKFYLKGRCEECGSITDIQSAGCNFLIVKAYGEGVYEALDKALGGG